jgi:hypothetical protein
MISWLSNSTKRRITQEIKDILYQHPRYREDVNNVQNKFAFDERPARGVIVDGTSSDRVVLSADNYMGRLSSFCMLTPVEDKPNTTVEWVRENFNELEALNQYRTSFPTAPGAYYFEVTRLPDDAHNIPGEVYIDPIMTVSGEPLITFGLTNNMEAQLTHDNICPGSLRLWLDNRRSLVPGVDYRVDDQNGSVEFLVPGPFNGTISADYRYILPRSGPHSFYREKFDVDMLPGVVIAFGDRCQLGDKFAVVVTDERTEVANVYGGKFEITFELLAFSKDSEDREKLSDYLVMKILERQNALGFEGIELTNITPGAENEDVFNPETDEYFYDATISTTFRVDWSIMIPLPVVLWRAEIMSKENELEHGYLDGTIKEDLVRMDPDGRVSYQIGKKLTYERMI